MVNIRRVPWKNKNEWLEVYEKLQGFNDLTKVEEAVQHMEIWIKRGQCPPAVEYTCKFMKSLSRDPHFFPALSNAESDAKLQMQYATSILKLDDLLISTVVLCQMAPLAISFFLGFGRLKKLHLDDS